MRIRKAFLSCAILTAAMLFMTTGAMAQVSPPPPVERSCFTSFFTAEVTGGPSIVTCSHSTTGQCTEIEYTVVSDLGKNDHVAVLEGAGVAYVKDGNGNPCGSACKIFNNCDGDNLTYTGVNACHEDTVRIDPQATKSTTFTVGLAGQRVTSPTSIVVKKGSKTEACTILGIGIESGPNPLATITKSVVQQFGTCQYEVVTEGGAPTCNTIGNGCKECKIVPAAEVDVEVNGEGGSVLFSEAVSFVVEGSTCKWQQYYPSAGPWIRVCY